jgi:hypothetical protein
MATHRDVCTVCTYAPGFTPGSTRWLGAEGHVVGLNFTNTYPGGASQMTCLLQVEPGYRTDALNPGRPTRIYRGASMIWDGNMMEPVPTKDGWQVQAIGIGAQSTNFCAWFNPGIGYTLNEPVNEAISRGLRWTNPGISSGWLVTAPDDGSFTVTDHMNQITSKAGMCWNVTRNGTLNVGAIPTVANRLLVSTAPVPRTLFGDVTTLFLYYIASDDGNGNQTYATQIVSNQADIDIHGSYEQYIDLSSATVNGTNNVLTSGYATQVGQYLLANYGRAMWAGPFIAQPGDLMTMGGVPIDLATEQAGTVCRMMVTNDPYGGEVVAGAIEFVVGSYQYDDDAQTASITPMQSFRNDLGTLLSNAVTWE